MYVNNEIGTIQPIDKIYEIIASKSPETIFFTDAVQAAGKIKLDLRKLPVNCASLSAHKLYAPKGIGLLYIRDFKKTLKSSLLLYMEGIKKKGLELEQKIQLVLLLLEQHVKL